MAGQWTTYDPGVGNTSNMDGATTNFMDMFYRWQSTQADVDKGTRDAGGMEAKSLSMWMVAEGQLSRSFGLDMQVMKKIAFAVNEYRSAVVSIQSRATSAKEEMARAERVLADAGRSAPVLGLGDEGRGPLWTYQQQSSTAPGGSDPGVINAYNTWYEAQATLEGLARQRATLDENFVSQMRGLILRSSPGTVKTLSPGVVGAGGTRGDLSEMNLVLSMLYADPDTPAG